MSKGHMRAKIGPVSGEIGGDPKQNRENSKIGLGFAAGLAAIGVLAYGCKKAVDYGYNWAKNKWLKKKEEKPTPTFIELQEPQEETLNETLNRCNDESVSAPLCGLYVRGGVNLIFSAPGVGKSILGYQAAIAMASGTSAGLVSDENEPVFQPIPVLYYDFEMNDADIKSRYGHASMCFPNNLRRIVNSPIFSAEDMLKEIATKADGYNREACIFIDNLSAFLSLRNSNEVREFIVGVKQIIEKQRREGKVLTIVLFAHSIKNHGEEPTLQDLAGSADVSRFVDCIYALAKTEGDERLLTSVKNRRAKNTPSINLTLVEDPYLHFEFSGYKDEASTEGAVPAQSAPNQKVSPEMEEKMKDWSAQGMAQKEIAAKLGVSEKTVQRYLKKS